MAAGRPELDAETWRIFGGLHRLLLRQAGRYPDEWMTHTRRMLGGGDLGYLPDTVTGSAVELGQPLRADEVDFLKYVLVAMDTPGGEPAALDLLSISEVTPATDHRFHPAPPHVLASAGARIPVGLDLTGGDPEELTDLPEDLAHLADVAEELTDLTDQLMVDTQAEIAGVLGVWRAWRFGPDGPPEGGRRVYLVEVDPGVLAWDVTHEAQHDLTRWGEEFPQVEVYWTGDELTPYHLAARAGSALLWAREPGRVRVAPVFGAGRAGFAAGHPRLPDGAERDELLARLRAGSVVDGADARAVDVVEPARGPVVPLTYRTDGRWAWPEAAAYYLAEYGLAPQTELVEHLRSAPQRDTVDGVGLFRAQRAVADEGPDGR